MKKQQDHIGSKIKAAREARGLSQMDLAKALGFQSATAISLIENGERGLPAETLKTLGEVLHQDIKYFLGQDEAPVDVQVALRADENLSEKDKAAISHLIEMAKKKHKDAK